MEDPASKEEGNISEDGTQGRLSIAFHIDAHICGHTLTHINTFEEKKWVK